jgi:protein TonB
MYADRNVTSGFKPGSLAAAVGINGALLAALMFSSPEVFAPPETPFEAYPVNADPPPPPPKPDVEKVEKPILERPIALPDAPDPIIEMPRTTDTIVGTPDPVPFTTGTTEGLGTITVDPPKPAPVFVDAAPDPRAMRDFQPPFPPSERRLGNTGSVTIRVLVGTDGRVKEVRTVSSASDAFLDVTRRQALAKWKFRPATRDGVPYETWRSMTVRFVLEG